MWNGNSLEMYLAMQFAVLIELLLRPKLLNRNTLKQRSIIKTEVGVQ